jgi:hypothetical protein
MSAICSASAFAQNDPATPANQACTAADLYCVAAGPSAAQNPSPFKIDQLSDPFFPDRNTESPKLLLEPVPQNSKEDEVLLKLKYGDLTAQLDPDARMAVPGVAGDSYCLKIRSYVVARDSKHSDSVHPAGYTTCVPASRFRLRTTEEHQTSESDSHSIRR